MVQIYFIYAHAARQFLAPCDRMCRKFVKSPLEMLLGDET